MTTARLGTGRPDRILDLICARLDDLPLTRFHWLLIVTIFIGVAFDNMDQITLSFAIPEYRREWDISVAVAGIHPAFGLGGTLIGAIFWGMVGDRIGRLRTLLVTIGIFSATSLINGFAASFPMVVAVCFVMGFGVGGAVPLAFTMLAEYLPVRYRSRTVVIVGILAITGGYAIAAIGAFTLLPAFGWRSLFLVGVLPAALIVWMARAIPESPRFLCSKGRYAEAEGIVRRLEAAAGRPAPRDTVAEALAAGPAQRQESAGQFGDLWSPPYVGRTIATWVFGLTWGFFNFGFLIWLPTTLRAAGYSAIEGAQYATILNAIAIPSAIVTAILYERWGSKPTLVLYPLLSGAFLALFGWLAGNGQLTPVNLVIVGGLIFFFGTTIAGVFAPYTAEIYGTRLRGTGSGWATGLTLVGALIGPVSGGGLIALGIPIFGQMLIFGVPLVLGAAALLALGVETRRRRLEEIEAEPAPLAAA